MKKRIISLILSIVMVVSMLPVQVLAAGAAYSEGLTYEISSDGIYYTVTGIGTCKDTELVIPETYAGLPVKEIRGFYDCDTLTGVTIPDSVTTIGAFAFQSCESLTSITIPDSVTTIGVCAFQSCESLTSITIPDSVTIIGDSAFSNCDSLTEIVVDAENTAYSNDQYGVLFNKDKTELICCPAAKTGAYTVPDTVTRIGAFAFHTCTSLTSVTIPDSVISIDDDAFSDCYDLTSVTIPDSVTAIGEYAFAWCKALTQIKFEGDTPSFGNNVFCYVTATAYYPAGNDTWTADVMQNYGGTITWVAVSDGPAVIASGTCGDDLTWTLTEDGMLTISGTGAMTDYTGVKYIPWYDYRSSITQVVIGDGATTICDYAFYWCESLTNVTIGNSVTTIGNNAFCQCTALKSVTIGNSVTTIGNDAFYWCGSLTDVTLPDSVTTIGKQAFYYCDALTGVTIPDSVTSIGADAFTRCDSLTEIVVGAENTVYSSDRHGVLFNKDQTELIFYPTGKTGEYTVPDTVTHIADEAFFGCDTLDGVTIPDSVIIIGNEAFDWCRGLTNVTIGNSVTTIGDYAFGDNYSLTSIVIPDSVTTIGECAFSNGALNEIYFQGNAPSFGNAVFNGISATAYYPDGNDTWTEDVRQNYGGTITWVPYGEEVCQHTETAVSGAVPATCTAPGYTGDTVCASCGELLAQGEEIPRLEHDYTETVTAPTCAAAGYTLHTCSLCGDSYISDYTEALGHNYQNTASLAPTCTAAGYDIYGCQNDGCDSEKKYIIPATGHQFGDDNVCDVCGFTVPEDHTHTYTSVVVLPTCTTAGYTEHTCDCGHSYQTDLMEPTGHHWDEGTVTVAPTCTEDGLLVYACVNCDAVITELLPAAHRWSTTVTKEPTCTEDGSATRVCESCGLEETVVLPAGHSWDEGVTTKAPTCTEDGTKTVTCTVCGATEVQPVEKLGHHFVNGVCTRCGSGIFDIVTPSNHHLQYGMYFDVDDVVSNYGPDLINEYGVYLDYNKDADIRRVGIYLTQEGNLWRRCIACVGEGITSATYVPYLSYGSDIKYTGLNNDGINVFPLSKNADGIWCYNDYATIGVNLEDRYGNLLLSLYDIGQSGARTRIFTDLDEMIRWLQEDIEAMCNDVGYPTVEEALAAAKSGDVVTLVDDAEVDVLLIPAGVTLDLDIYDLHAKGVLGITGSKLTAAEYSVGSDWGKLYVQGPEYLVLSGCVENNNGKEVGLLPVWDGDNGCYVMGGALYNTDNYTLTTDESTISFMFAPSLRGDLRKGLFTDEGEMSDNGLAIVLRLTWHSGDGLAQQDFVYSSEFVSKFCKSGSGLFTFMLTGYEAMYIELEDLTITPMIVCDNGLVFCGQTVTGA